MFDSFEQSTSIYFTLWVFFSASSSQRWQGPWASLLDALYMGKLDGLSSGPRWADALLLHGEGTNFANSIGRKQKRRLRRTLKIKNRFNTKMLEKCLTVSFGDGHILLLAEWRSSDLFFNRGNFYHILCLMNKLKQTKWSMKTDLKAWNVGNLIM